MFQRMSCGAPVRSDAVRRSPRSEVVVHSTHGHALTGALRCALRLAIIFVKTASVRVTFVFLGNNSLCRI